MYSDFYHRLLLLEEQKFILIWQNHPLMVQYTCSIPSFKLLLLEDAFKVLHPLLQVPHVSRQVTVEKAHWVAKDCHPRTNTAFIPLKVTGKGKQYRDKSPAPIKEICVKGWFVFFPWHRITESESQTACCCTDLKGKETAPAAGRGWCWHQTAWEGQTLTHSPMCACTYQQEEEVQTHYLYQPYLSTLSWHWPIAILETS